MTDLVTKKPVVVKITMQSQVVKIPAQVAQGLCRAPQGAAQGPQVRAAQHPAKVAALVAAALGRDGRVAKAARLVKGELADRAEVGAAFQTCSRSSPVCLPCS